MARNRHVGRAFVRRRPIGRARVATPARIQPPAPPTPEQARTNLLRLDGNPPPPVFVDASGRRRRGLRRTTYAVAAVLLVALVVLWLSQFAGQVRP